MRKRARTVRLIDIRNKLRRLAAKASIAFGVFLTLAWVGSLIFIVYYFLD